jgi:lysophospholipid acyltransferase (LPLAT)-like uncharacterized protein
MGIGSQWAVIVHPSVPRPATAKAITVPQHVAAFAGGGLLKLLGRTLRFRWEDRAGFFDPARTKPVILGFWHNRLLGAVLGIYRAGRTRSPLPMSALSSASTDGGWVAAMVQRFGIGSVRGSSTRRGAAAVLEMSHRIAGGSDIAITPDGPRGPKYQVAPGIIYLARLTGARIIPVKIQLSHCWRVGKTWDLLWIPKPFSRLTATLMEPLTISPEEGPLEPDCARLAAALGTD